MSHPSIVLVVLGGILVALPAHAQDECRARRIEADRLVAAHDYTAAASIYMEVVRAQPPCPRMDEVLFNLAIAYRGAGLVGRAIRARSTLITQFPASPHARTALFLQAGDYHAMAIYTEAAQHYAAFAERHPDELGEACTAEARANGVCPDATVALENAIFFQLSLGERGTAEASAALYARHYGARRPQQTASIAFAMRRGLDDPGAIAIHAEAFLETYDATAHLHERAMALVALARARIAQGRPDDASAALARVIALVTPEALATLAGTELERAVHRARSRDALAEARFLSAEQRLIVIAAPPRYAGPRTEAGLRAWVEGPFSTWRDRQLEAIAPSIDAYERIAQDDIPQWTIAAAGKVGQLRTQVLGAGRSVSAPSWASEALVTSFEQAREHALASVAASALDSYQFCALAARGIRWFSDRSVQCEDALVDLDPSHHSTPRELHGEPTHASDNLALPEPAHDPTDG